MIISASRRTDIPAFYSKWFMNRIREGFLFIKNPFNSKQISKIDLKPDSIEAIVFWTRNPLPLFSYLDELTSLGYNYYFQYTITGYPKILEKNAPQLDSSIETFRKLSEKIGPEKVIWRYDPIIHSNITELDYHFSQFKNIADKLAGYSNRIMISFIDLYEKTKNNIKKLETNNNLKFYDINPNTDFFIKCCSYMSEVARENKFEIYSCAEKFDFSKFGIKHGKCIDEELINKLFHSIIHFEKDKNQREECGCMKSRDIGIYNTCIHGCEYCYANVNKNLAQKNFEMHDYKNCLLTGDIPKETIIDKNRNLRLDQFI